MDRYFLLWRFISKAIVLGMIVILVLVLCYVEIKAATPPEEKQEMGRCGLFYNKRDMGTRPCIDAVHKGVHWVVFFSEDKSRIDLVFFNRGNGLEVYYVSEQLRAAANSLDT